MSESLSWRVLEEVEAALPGESVAVMVYGSQARGTAGPGSDVDVLQVVAEPVASYTSGRVEVTAFTAGQLYEMSRDGGLFVLHLRQDGRLVRDERGVLAGVLAAYRQPASYGPYRRDLAAAAQILDVGEAEFARHGQELTRLALFAARSCASIRTVEAGHLVTDAELFADALGDAELGAALAVRRKDAPFTPEDLDALLRVLRRYLDIPARPPAAAIADVVARLRAERPRAASVVAAYLPGDGQRLQAAHHEPGPEAQLADRHGDAQAG